MLSACVWVYNVFQGIGGGMRVFLLDDTPYCSCVHVYGKRTKYFLRVWVVQIRNFYAR